MPMKLIRIGSGAGYSGDRISPAVELANQGDLHYLIFECLAERTVALAQLEKSKNPDAGFDPLLRDRMKAVLQTCVVKGIKIITNMGAANPISAAQEVISVARELDVRKLKIAVVQGDDVLTHVFSHDFHVIETGEPINLIKEAVISANAYLGVEPIVQALKMQADIVITGRVSDPALFLAPLIHEFEWPLNDWAMMGKGILIGHLLECAGQITGGYFADPGYRDVPNLATLGFPFAEVSEDGSAIITKVEGSGGCVTVATCISQMLYEIGDPSAYFQPDVIADFSNVVFTEVGKDRIRIEGATGQRRPEMIKVTLGVKDGFVGEGQISYAGEGALARSQLALEVLRNRLEVQSSIEFLDIRYDLIGVNSIHGNALSNKSDAYEIRARVAARVKSRKEAEFVANEVEAMYLNGPAGGGGAVKSVREVVAALSVMVPRQMINTSVTLVEV